MERVEGDCFCSQTMRFLRCSLEFKLLLRHSWKLEMFLKNNDSQTLPWSLIYLLVARPVSIA